MVLGRSNGDCRNMMLVAILGSIGVILDSCTCCCCRMSFQSVVWFLQHVPRINGEIPSIDEATSDHQRLLDRYYLRGVHLILLL